MASSCTCFTLNVSINHNQYVVSASLQTCVTLHQISPLLCLTLKLFSFHLSRQPDTELSNSFKRPTKQRSSTYSFISPQGVFIWTWVSNFFPNLYLLPVKFYYTSVTGQSTSVFSLSLKKKPRVLSHYLKPSLTCVPH